MTQWEKLLSGLDAEQQLPAVLDGRNTIVSAGAGSGKTRVLAIRYLHLVKEKNLTPERILCLTFTNKAATEMHERIYAMMRQCALDDRVFREALAVFGSAPVSTLDSFCSGIARNGCMHWGFPPDFSIDELAADASMEKLALGYLLEKREEKLAGSYIAANGFQGAIDGLVSVSKSRDGLFGFRKNTDTKKNILSTMDTLHRQVLDLMLPGASMEFGGAKAAKAWALEASTLPLLPPDDSRREDYSEAKKKYNKINNLSKPSGNSDGPVYYASIADQAKDIAGILVLCCDALLENNFAELDAFLQGFVKQAIEERIKSGILGFADVAYMAKKTLEQDTTLRQWYKNKFDAIMVDEFQDDNLLQKELLYLLAETPASCSSSVPLPAELSPGKLFFVGDEKQSIYAFRNADVSVFKSLSTELLETPGGIGDHKLLVNWRSEPALVSFFNSTFSVLMPPHPLEAPYPLDAPLPEEAPLEYEARFTALGAGPATVGVEPVVSYAETAEIDESETDDLLTPSEAEAWHIAQSIRDIVGNKELITGKGAPGGARLARQCGYEDICVLFRSTAKQHLIERYFRLFHIPYTSKTTTGLYAESIFGDIFCMLRLAVYPDDSLSFAAVLRGPFARLSDDTVSLILSSPGQTAFSFPGEKFPDADARAYAAADAMLKKITLMADTASLAEIVSWLWYEGGLRWNVLKDGKNHSYAEHFDYLWAMANDADKREQRLAGFVNELEAKLGTVEKLDETNPFREETKGVSLLTIHASKGLEYPVVFLPGLNNVGTNGRSEACKVTKSFGPSIRLLDADGIAVNTIAAIDSDLRRMGKKYSAKHMDEQQAETIRLFYVACTRAISRLYCSSPKPRTNDVQGKSFRSMLFKAWPHLESGDSGTAPISGTPVSAKISSRSITEYSMLQASSQGGSTSEILDVAARPAFAVFSRQARWSVTEAARKTSVDYVSRSGQDEASPIPEEKKAAREEFSEADFGTLCHSFTGALITAPQAVPEPDRRISAKLARLGQQNRETILAEALELARAFSLSSRGLQARTAFEKSGTPGSDSFFFLEYPFIWRGEAGKMPVFVSGIMDMVYGDKNSATVIDFKTDRLVVQGSHSFQLAVYRESAGDIFGVPCAAYVHFLRSGEESKITDIILTESLATQAQPFFRELA